MTNSASNRQVQRILVRQYGLSPFPVAFETKWELSGAKRHLNQCGRQCRGFVAKQHCAHHQLTAGLGLQADLIDDRF